MPCIAAWIICLIHSRKVWVNSRAKFVTDAVIIGNEQATATILLLDYKKDKIGDGMLVK